jgi:hypothetical protein
MEEDLLNKRLKREFFSTLQIFKCVEIEQLDSSPLVESFPKLKKEEDADLKFQLYRAQQEQGKLNKL